MKCPQCQHENSGVAKFCEECGTKLVWVCSGCGHEVSPRAKFCPECGMPLTGQSPAPSPQVAGGQKPRAKAKPAKRKTKSEKREREKTKQPTAERRSFLSARREAPEAERRQLTVMFCDLVGSTPLAEKLDPEELREVILAYQEACAAEIRRFEGYLARYVGDGLLVYFGYPQAHEDDAQRAVRAGLGIVEEMQKLTARLQQTVGVIHALPLQVRIGIHTGLVVVGEMGGGGFRDPMAIVGETPNIAARLQGLAEPDTVLISAATQRLIQGYFTCRDLGPQQLKGVSTPLAVYRVLGETGAQSRLEVAAPVGLTPLVGREQEVGLLLERWERAKEGSGQVVLLTGEAGIGKSRLVQELKERMARGGYTRIEFRCSPYYQNTAFYPVIEHVQRLLQFRREDSPQEKLDKLEKALKEYHLPLQEVVPLFAALLSLPHPEGYPPLTLSPPKQKQKTQEAVIAWLLAEAERKPVLAAWEDLHWADPSTLELHSLLIDQAPTVRILTLLTFRPEFSPSWGARSHLTQLTLSRLGRTQVQEMVEKITGGKTLPAEVVQQIVAKTDGVPLFVEELTKMVVESGLLREEDGHYVGTHGRAPLLLGIPATLHDALMARLDRLATVKEVAQLGATLGREFSYELLQAVAPVDETSLQQALAKLVEAEVLYQRGLVPQARYLFKHALIQDAAYQSLLKSKRQQYHNQIAQVLEERFAETKETQPELLAHHYTEAGLIEQAIPYWQQAGLSANQRSAHVEAINHLTRGLELLKALPDTPKRLQQELALQVTLGAQLMATRGYGAPEVEKAYARARELCRQVGETPQLFHVLLGLWAFYVVRAEYKTARALGEQLFTLAQSTQDPVLLVWAHVALGEPLYYVGEFALARAHMEQGIAFYDPQKHRSPYGVQDPGVTCLCYAARVLWLLGYPDQALKRSHEALTLAHELSSPFNLAHALDFAAMFHQLRREGQATQELAEKAITLSTEQGFPLWLTLGTNLRGWALAEQGQREEGIKQMCQGLSASRATGAELGQPLRLALLAEAYGKAGQAEEGLSALDEALAMADKNGERGYEAELYRLYGELSLRIGEAETGRTGDKKILSDSPILRFPDSSPEECFHKAIEIAQRQRAKSWELRAVMSLSRLWRQQGKQEEARQLLAEIYGWFTEGFDTADLREAKKLLEELSH